MRGAPVRNGVVLDFASGQASLIHKDEALIRKDEVVAAELVRVLDRFARGQDVAELPLVSARWCPHLHQHWIDNPSKTSQAQCCCLVCPLWMTGQAE